MNIRLNLPNGKLIFTTYAPLFSERYGYRQPAIKLWSFRIFYVPNSGANQ